MAESIPTSVTELLQAMVRVNSVNPALPGSTGGEAALVERLEAIAEVWGLATRWLPVAGRSDQLLVTLKVAEDRPWLLFDSHLDTVAVEGMTIDPFGAELRDGKVWGRGACDTKGTGAAMLWAMKQYAEATNYAEKPHNLALLFSVDEEVSMQGVAAFVGNNLPELGWFPAAAIVGEPTELHPVIAHNGCLRWTLTTHGKACHSSVPHEGVSAISAMVRLIDLIEREYIPALGTDHPLTGLAACSINLIRGGSAPNIIPDTCTVEIDRRLVPGEDSAEVVRVIDELVTTFAQRQEPSIEFTQEVQVDHPPLGTERNGPLGEYLKPLLAQQGLSKLLLGAPFATHAPFFDDVGIPTIVLGPGSPHKAHTKDEWVAIDQIEQGVEFYRRIMQTPLPTTNG